MRKLRLREVKALVQGHTRELELEPSSAPFPQCHDLMSERPRTTYLGSLSGKLQSFAAARSARAQSECLAQVGMPSSKSSVAELYLRSDPRAPVSSSSGQVTEPGSDPVSH